MASINANGVHVQVAPFASLFPANGNRIGIILSGNAGGGAVVHTGSSPQTGAVIGYIDDRQSQTVMGCDWGDMLTDEINATDIIGGGNLCLMAVELIRTP